MKTLLDRLDGLANNMGSAIYEDAETCGEAAAELRRLHEVNQELLAALKHARTLVDEWGNCASQYEQERYGLQSDLLMLDAAIDKGEQA